MNYRISRQADRDLDEIWLHIARDSEDAVNRVDEELHAAMRMLLRMPGMGHHRSEIQDPRYRFPSVHA